jgi:phenylacetate-CoA ligase
METIMDEQKMIQRFKNQLNRISELEFYKKRFNKYGINPKAINSLEDFQKIPPMDLSDLTEAFLESPPLGSLCHPKTQRVNLSPGPKGFLPILFTDLDIENMGKVNADSFRAAGITSDDIVAITFGYHIFIAGLSFQGGFEALGCKTIPVGPGDAHRTADIINRFGVTVLVSNPSFALRCAEEGAKGIRILLAGGEPFSSVEGFKDKVRAAYGQIGMIDTYGLAQVSPLARECSKETGLHILDEWVYVEIIDPETGKVSPDGQRGEVVVTNLMKESSPLLRFRTGDLSILVHEKCSCGREATLPNGVIGSISEMHKIKGVKIYPSQMGPILKGFPELSGNYRFIVSSSGSTDYLEILVEGDAPADFDLSALKARVKQVFLISPNKISMQKDIGDGPPILDKRY